MSSLIPLRRALLPALVFLLAGIARPSLAIDLGVQVGGVGVGVEVGGGSGPLGVGVDADVDLGGDGDGLHVDLGGDGLEVGIGNDTDTGIDGAGGGSSPAGASPTRLEQEGALEAVRTHRALPLANILAKARAVTDGEIIDAQLISVRSILLYQLKVLGKGGDVSQLYFYARSGLPVRAD